MNYEELIRTVALYGGGTLLGLLALLTFIKQFLVIGRPNELLVFSGRKHRLEESGEEVGWRIVRGGRSVRIPLLERVDRMNMETMPIDIKIRGAYAKGNIPIHVDAVANAKITSDETKIHHAIERFLMKSTAEIRQVIKETLEGTLRGVLAQLTPEEINHDRQKLAETLKNEVADDLERMGLMVDTFKIQHVSDDMKYLDSIGRVRISEVLRDAEIAESDAERDSEQVVAGARSRGLVALENAHGAIAEKENELTRIKAELDATARAEEERTAAAAREARAMAEQKLQQIRGVLEELRLEAETIIPADRERAARELRAAGDAAIRAETGRAQGDALASLFGVWSQAGPRAREIFLLQQVDGVLAQVADATQGLEVGRVNLIDGGDGQALARYVGSYPAVVTELLVRIKETVGVDVPGILAMGAAPKAPAQKEVK